MNSACLSWPPLPRTRSRATRNRLRMLMRLLLLNWLLSLGRLSKSMRKVRREPSLPIISFPPMIEDSFKNYAKH